MSSKVISVTKMYSKVGGDFSLTDNFRTAEANLQDAYQVFTTPDATIDDVLQANGIPAAGSSYSGDYPYVFAEAARPQRISPVYWIVNLAYRGEIKLGSGSGSSNPSQSPLLTPAKIDWDDVETEMEIDEDVDGNPIVTRNGEAINGVKRLFADQTVTIRKNMLFFSPYIQAAYRQSVNADLFLGWPPGTGKMTKFSASSVKSSDVGGGGYWEVSATIQFRYPYRTIPENAWYARVRHEGYYKRIFTQNTGSNQIVRAMRGGEPTVKPVLLDAIGVQIPDVEPPNTVEAYWLEFKLYNPLPYGALGLLP
jgi:hypothetical protein